VTSPPSDFAPREPAGPFGRRGARWLAAVAALSLVASAVLAVFADAFEVPSYAADAFSRSAIGHHAFVELLRRLGHTVILSRSRTAEKVSGATLVVAEPLLGPPGQDDVSRRRLRGMIKAADHVLVVLPKRLGVPDRLRPRWLSGAIPLPEDLPNQVLGMLEVAGVHARVVHPLRTISGWRGELPAPDVSEPQLVTAKDLVPLLSTDEGMLVGERVSGSMHLILLADPDVLETHGLGRGRNAELAAALLERLGAGASTAIVVDETLHGHELRPSLARELLRWPLVLATLQAALALALLGWAALVRFGRPRRAAEALAPGKEFLVRNTAELLRHGGHVAPAVSAYWRAAKEQIAHALRPPGERSADLDRFVVALAAARERGERLEALEHRVAALAPRPGAEQEALRAALDIHAFREEMVDGARRNP